MSNYTKTIRDANVTVDVFNINVMDQFAFLKEGGEIRSELSKALSMIKKATNNASAFHIESEEKTYSTLDAVCAISAKVEDEINIIYTSLDSIYNKLKDDLENVNKEIAANAGYTNYNSVTLK